MFPVKESNGNNSLVKELRHLQVFRRLSDADLQSILSCVRVQHHEMGEVLFQTGEPNRNSLFILYRGRVGLWGPKGGKYEVDPGAILGLSNYMDGLRFSFTAIALTSISVLVVTEMKHEELERLCPVLKKLLNRLIADKIRDRQTTQQSFTGSMTRPAKVAMKTPLATCGPNVSLEQAHRIMDGRKIGSLVVTGPEGELVGLLTYAGLAEAVLVKGASPDDNIMKVSCETAYTVSLDTPLWEVEEIQHRNALKYVIVTDGNRPIGMISQTDILHNLLNQRGGIRDEVRTVKSFSGLNKLSKRLVSIASDALERNHYASNSVRVISEFHLALQRRCVELTLQEMASSGKGKSPVKFALLIMGSGGRREMMLRPDQDNGIIIGGPSEVVGKDARSWFQGFTERLNQHLEQLGYTLCPDEIMAKNPMCHMTLDEWREKISNVTTMPTKEAARWVKVLLDLDTLYGDKDLTETLRELMLAELRDKAKLIKMMVEDNAEWCPPLGFFNQLIPMGFFNTEGGASAKGKIDIKCNGLRILADIVRIYAFKTGIRNRNTIDRITGLVRQGELSVEYANSLKASYEALLDMLLVHQIKKAEKGKQPDKLINPNHLSTMDHEILRISMRVIKGFQEKLQTDF